MEIDTRIQNFIQYLGHDPLLVEYSVRFADRRVFQYSTDESLRVCKIRPESEKAYKEIENAQKWFPYNGIQDVHHTASEGLIALDMPWLGLSLSALSDIALGYLDYYDQHDQPFIFKGFAPLQIGLLIEELNDRMSRFASTHGLVHGDLYAGAPNNLLYLPGSDHLTIIDPEAFSTLDNNSWGRYCEQMNNVHQYMMDYLNTRPL